MALSCHPDAKPERIHSKASPVDAHLSTVPDLRPSDNFSFPLSYAPRLPLLHARIAWFLVVVHRRAIEFLLDMGVLLSGLAKIVGYKAVGNSLPGSLSLRGPQAENLSHRKTIFSMS